MVRKSKQTAEIATVKPKMKRAEFARHMKVSPAAVTKAIRSGLIKVGKDDFIDVASQSAAWRVNRDETKVREAGRPPKVPTPDQIKDLEELAQIRLKNANLDLELKERELAKSKGELVSRDEVKRAISDFSRLLSQKLTNFPSRYGLEIAAASNAEPRTMIATLDRFMRVQIEELSSTKPTLPG